MDLEILKAQWEDLEDWKKLFIVLVISAGLGFLVYMFILSSKIEEKKRLEAELNKKMMEFEVIKRNASPERRAELIQELERVKLETEALKRQLEEVKAKFKPRDDINRTINFITAVANKNGVVIENIKVVSTENVRLRYNPITDSVETVVDSSVQNPNAKGLKPRLAPVKHLAKNKGKNNKDNKNPQEENNNMDLTNTVNLKRFKYTVDLRGTTGGILKVIKDIVNTKNFVNVEKVKLAKDKKKNGLVQTSLELVSYTEGNNSLELKKDALTAKQEVRK